jgi:anti-anti-sigma regulatory factor
MDNWLSHWLNNTPLTNPVERRQAGVFQTVLLVWIALTSVGIPALLLIPPDPTAPAPPPQVMFSLMILSIAAPLLWVVPIVALVLLRRGLFRQSVATAALGLLLAHSIAAYILGTRTSSVLIVYQIPIALAGLLAGRRLLLSISGLTLAIVIAIGILEALSPPLAGFFGPPTDNTAGGAVADIMTIGFFIGVTVLSTVLLDRFGSALREALNGSLEREDELNGIRASLENTVSERTAELQSALSDVRAQAAEQQHLLAEIEQQRATIQDLSVPVIPISATTLIMPLVGALDSTRLRQAQEQSLQALERSQARTLVVDITGVPIVDTQVAQGLLMMVRSAGLLGANVALVGIRPEVAQTMVGLGIDLRDVRTFSDLHSALDHAAA